MRGAAVWGAAALALALAGCANLWSAEPTTAVSQTTVSPTEPPGGRYVKVSSLVNFPDFYPGLGTLYVQPDTLPLGPFQAYDRQGRLVSTIYMVPIADFDAHQKLGNLESSPLPVTYVDMFFNKGHPGVDVPHYHIILWHVSRERALNLK